MKFKTYYLTAVFSMIFAVLGFSYNAWRLEVSEDNNNIRTATFEVLTELAKFQQLIYSAHYDQNTVAGNPRNGWVKVGLIVDLSTLIDESVTKSALVLKESWSANWESIPDSRNVTDMLVSDIEKVRFEIKKTLKNLE